MTMKRRRNGHLYNLDGCAKSIYDFPDVGKTWEIDGKRYCAVNGAVCAQGRKVNVPTPCNDKVVELIHRIENGELTPSRENVLLFK